MPKKAMRFQPHNRLYRDKWSVAIYVRLSDEDRDKQRKGDLSRSIVNQTDFIRTFIECVARDEQETYSMQEYKVYCDDDYSGMTFERAAFREMMHDVQQDKVDCIIVKNLSRLGRYDTEMQRYLEEEFEQEGKEVRLIAISDHYDSLYMELGMITKFILLMNREYSETQHRNVSIGMHTMQKKGLYIGAFAPYGYQKDSEDKHHLVVDITAAEVVREIFCLYLDGKAPKEIAGILTGRGIVNPACYKRQQGSNFRCGTKISWEEFHWTGASVKHILMNETYTGTLVQHKQEKRRLLDRRPRQLPREEWVRCEGTHEPIISKEDWQKAQRMMKTVRRDAGKGNRETIFKGLLRCGDCGHAMRKKWERYTTKAGESHQYLYYNCGTFRDYGSPKSGTKQSAPGCTSHYISDKMIRSVILNDINEMLGQMSVPELLERHRKPEPNAGESLRGAIRAKETERDQLQKRQKSARNKWLDGLLSDEEYGQVRQEMQQELDTKTAEIRILEETEQRLATPVLGAWVEQLAENGKLTELDRATVVELVEKIEVYENHQIKIVYYFG